MKTRNVFYLIYAFFCCHLHAYGGVFDTKLGGPEIRGIVVDTETGSRIPDAIVIWVWRGQKNLGFVDSQTACYRIDLAVSDKNGGFSFKSWSIESNLIPKFHDRVDAALAVYKPGYTLFFPNRYNRLKPSFAEIKLQKIKEDSERLQLLWGVYNALNCSYLNITMTEGARIQAVKVLEDIISEATNLPVSSERQVLIKASKNKLNEFQSLRIDAGVRD